MSSEQEDPLEELARARDRVRVTRHNTPQTPPPQQQPVYVFVPPSPHPQRVSGDASSFRWGFGLTFGSLCAVALFMVLSCMGLGMLIRGTTGTPAPNPSPSGGAPTGLPSPQQLTVKPVFGSNRKLELHVTNPRSETAPRVVVLLRSSRVSSYSVRLTFTNIPAGKTATALVDSDVLQREAAQGMFPTATIVE